MKAMIGIAVIFLCLGIARCSEQITKNFLSKEDDPSSLITIATNETSAVAFAVQSQSDLNFYHSILNDSYFYGNWMSDQETNTLGFQRREGFVFTNSRFKRSFDIQISIFDGLYVDQAAVALSFDYEANMPVINAKNGTIYFQHLWVEYMQTESSRIFNTENYCLTNATIYFLDLENEGPLVPRAGELNFENIGIQFEITSPYCPFAMVTTVMTNRDHVRKYQQKCLIVSLLNPNTFLMQL